MVALLLTSHGLPLGYLNCVSVTYSRRHPSNMSGDGPEPRDEPIPRSVISVASRRRRRMRRFARATGTVTALHMFADVVAAVLIWPGVHEDHL